VTMVTVAAKLSGLRCTQRQARSGGCGRPGSGSPQRRVGALADHFGRGGCRPEPQVVARVIVPCAGVYPQPVVAGPRRSLPQLLVTQGVRPQRGQAPKYGPDPDPGFRCRWHSERTNGERHPWPAPRANPAPTTSIEQERMRDRPVAHRVAGEFAVSRGACVMLRSDPLW
jgi:hypothetical protein